MLKVIFIFLGSIGCLAFTKSIIWRFRTGYQRDWVMGWWAFMAAVIGIIGIVASIKSALDILA